VIRAPFADGLPATRERIAGDTQIDNADARNYNTAGMLRCVSAGIAYVADGADTDGRYLRQWESKTSGSALDVSHVETKSSACAVDIALVYIVLVNRVRHFELIW